MVFLLIFGILLGAASVIFALQNIAIVTVTFFGWHAEGSLALILLIAAFTGVLTSLFIILPESISNYFGYKNLKRENMRLEEELRRQKELTAFAKITPLSSETLSKIEDGAIIHP